MDLSLARSDVIGDRRLRMASSSPDVKALFNSPAYIYNLSQADQEDQDTNFIPNSAGSETDHWTPLPPIVGFVARSLVPRSLTTHQGSGVHRTRHSEDAMKRGSDSLLEAKLKDQLSKQTPRSLNNRAQSLDLTYSLSRITENSTNQPRPESPSTSTGGELTGGNSSPNSVTALSFPSVYGPPSRSSLGSNPPMTRHDGHDGTSMDEVTRVIAGLGL